MAHAAVNWVINDIDYAEAIKPAARWLLVQIADRADRDDWACWPSHKTLAKDAGMSSRSVLSLLSLLEEHSIILRSERLRPNGTRSTDMITILRTAEVAVPVSALNQSQVATSGSAEVAALNHVIEPGKGTDVIVIAPDPFEEWWAAYPRKIGKVDARKAWGQKTAEISALTIAVLMERTSAYAESVLHHEERFILHGATFLRGERWNDELPTHRSQTDGTTGTDRSQQRAAAGQQTVVDGTRLAIAEGRRQWW